MLELAINIIELAYVLHRGEEMQMECFLDLHSGKILNIPTNPDLVKRLHHKKVSDMNFNEKYFVDHLISDKSSYLYIPDLFKQNIYNLMSSFVNEVEKRNFVDSQALWNTIQSEGGFSEFHSIISGKQKLYDLFIEFRDRTYKKFAIGWLKENQIKIISANQENLIN
ncbi:MAG: hypothetical protein JXR46_13770 [Calditrichaceae bacterium]|nr:hypothetical protein [Calditrichaceae bacterium]MBN2710104.1 hypothetical protein [Calditrichaceae bacterium]